jgi:hypothetical protein
VKKEEKGGEGAPENRKKRDNKNKRTNFHLLCKNKKKTLVRYGGTWL